MPHWHRTLIFEGTEEMSQWLTTLSTLPEDLDLIPSAKLAAHNCL